jgi:hypothetical protein
MERERERGANSSQNASCKTDPHRTAPPLLLLLMMNNRVFISFTEGCRIL